MVDVAGFWLARFHKLVYNPGIIVIINLMTMNPTMISEPIQNNQMEINQTSGEGHFPYVAESAHTTKEDMHVVPKPAQRIFPVNQAPASPTNVKSESPIVSEVSVAQEPVPTIDEAIKGIHPHRAGDWNDFLAAIR